MAKPLAAFPFSTPMPSWRLLLFALFGVVILSAAGMAIARRETRTARQPIVHRSPAVDVYVAPEPEAAAYQTQASASARAAATVPPPPLAVTTVPDIALRAGLPLLIRTGSMQLRVDTLARALARAESLAARVGGVIAATTAAGRDGRLDGASLTIRAPQAAWERLVNGLGRLGDVERLQTQAEDVGEEYVDVEARLANGRRLEARLLALLATRTGRLTDVLATERELARVREDVETLEGRRRYLERSVAYSTLQVELVSGRVAPAAQAGLFREAAGDAVTSFLWLAAFLVRISGVVLPLSAVAVLGWWLYRRAERKSARNVLPLSRLNVS